MYPENTAVYNAHVKTTALARTLKVDWRLLRIVPAHRSAASHQVRQEIAAAARAVRARKGRFPAPRVSGVVTGLPIWLQQEFAQ